MPCASAVAEHFSGLDLLPLADGQRGHVSVVSDPAAVFSHLGETDVVAVAVFGVLQGRGIQPSELDQSVEPSVDRFAFFAGEVRAEVTAGVNVADRHQTERRGDLESLQRLGHQEQFRIDRDFQASRGFHDLHGRSFRFLFLLGAGEDEDDHADEQRDVALGRNRPVLLDAHRHLLVKEH